MKKVRSITNGIALMLAVFLLIYLATLYLKFKPDDVKLEKGISKLMQFFDNSQNNRDYFRVTFLLVLSAAVGLIFKKRPEYGAFTAVGALCYILILYEDKLLTVHPMVILSLTLCHTAGAVIQCGYRDRFEPERRHASNASLLCSLLSLGMTVYTLFYQSRLRAVAEMSEALSARSVVLNNKIAFQPKLVELVYLKLQNSGANAAHALASDLALDVDLSSFQSNFLAEVKAEEFSVFLRLCILLFSVSVLVFFLRTRLRLLPALLSFAPAVYSVIHVHKGDLSAFPEAIMAACFLAAVFAYTAFDQAGKGKNTVFIKEAPVPSEPDETYYS